MTATTLTGVLLKGVAASRPAASAVAAGTLYSATDTGAITQSDGVSTWSAYATITAGAMATDALWDAAGDLAVGTGANTGAKLAADATATKVLHAGSSPSWSAVVEADMTLADNTTNNAATTKHGFAPKYPNDATKYLDGTGAYTVPAGSGGTLTSVNATLTAGDVTLTQNTYTDILSVSLVAGTWLVIASTTTFSVSAAQDVSVRISDGSTHYANGAVSLNNSSYEAQVTVAAIIVLGSTTTMKMQGTGTGGSGSKALRATASNTAGNIATQINAVKIA